MTVRTLFLCRDYRWSHSGNLVESCFTFVYYALDMLTEYGYQLCLRFLEFANLILDPGTSGQTATSLSLCRGMMGLVEPESHKFASCCVNCNRKLVATV
jgi:hypothetical protein